MLTNLNFVIENETDLPIGVKRLKFPVRKGKFTGIGSQPISRSPGPNSALGPLGHNEESTPTRLKQARDQ